MTQFVIHVLRTIILSCVKIQNYFLLCVCVRACARACVLFEIKLLFFGKCALCQ